jgi:hypothetical protein
MRPACFPPFTATTVSGDRAIAPSRPGLSALCQTRSPLPMSIADRRPSFVPTSTWLPDTTGELRTTRSFNW